MAPSPLHQNLSNKALSWLTKRATNKGIRGGLEIKIKDNYIADAAALGMIKAQYAKELQIPYHSWPISNDSLRHSYSFVFEAKATRSDFFKTFGPSCKIDHKNRRERVADFHFVVVPKNLISVEELGNIEIGWGVLEMSSRGLSLIKHPEFCDVPESYNHNLAYNLLWAGSRI